MEYKNLSDRKKRILSAVIQSYIDNGQPVSSSELRDKYFNEISSATIRNELSALEEMGFLVQPHTSSGRIPSAEAYRIYVANMLTEAPLSSDEAAIISGYFDGGVMAVEDIIRRTAKVISDLTNYTSVIVLKDIDNIKIRKIDLVDVGDGRALVIIVTDGGIISNKTVTLPQGTTGSFLNVARTKLNNVFAGRRIREFDEVDELVDVELAEFEAMIKQIVTILRDFEARGDKVLLEGESKIFEHPEYCESIDETKNFLTVISRKDRLHDIIARDEGIEFSLKIGDDKEDGGLEHCAIVTAKYSIGGSEIGQAGVIGPTRMDYSKIKAVLAHIARLLNDVK